MYGEEGMVTSVTHETIMSQDTPLPCSHRDQSTTRYTSHTITDANNRKRKLENVYLFEVGGIIWEF